MTLDLRRKRVATILTWLLTCLPANAGLITAGEILESYAFPNGTFATGSQSFNIWDDTSGSVLLANNGDLNDLTITYSNTIGALGSGGLEYNSTSDTLRASQSFSGAVATNNPGSRIVQTVTFEFANHVSITDLRVDFNSLNSRGTVWETSALGYLQEDGTLFSSTPVVDIYDSHTVVDGTPSLGWFVTDSRATVTNVGTSTVTSGSNGQNDNLTQADAGIANRLDYADVGLADGTRVGGFRWITILEDVRGTLNSSANFTTTLTSFDGRGSIQGVPEPSAMACLALLCFSGALQRRRRPQRVR